MIYKKINFRIRKFIKYLEKSDDALASHLQEEMLLRVIQSRLDG